MKRLPLFRVLASLFAVFCFFSLYSAIPDGYYDGISGLKDRDLKNKLHTIVNIGNTNSYDKLFDDSFVHTDVRSDGTWWDMYSDKVVPVYVNGAINHPGMHREHSFPKSWWGGAENDAYTDLNHLYPADGSANMSKSNHPLGEVDISVSFSDYGKSKTGKPVAGQGGGDKRVFEPDDEYKGDFARTYFYMVTCYQHLTWDLKYNFMTVQGDYPTLQKWAIDLLLKWHRADPVSEKETNRNEEVYKIQKNRNPFIDYPLLAEYIWGDKVGSPFNVEEVPPTGKSEITSPTNGQLFEIGEVIVGESKVITIPLKGIVTGDLNVSVAGADKVEFSVPITTIGWKEFNSGNYNLQVTYSPVKASEAEANIVFTGGGLAESHTITVVGVGCDMPEFDAPVAHAATQMIGAQGFVIPWDVPVRPAKIDYYVVTVTEFYNGASETKEYRTNSDENYYNFTEMKEGAEYAYFVQSVRLGHRSPKSNTVTFKLGGIEGLNAQPFAIARIQNGIQFRCEGTHSNARIIDMTGRVVSTIPTVSDGDCVLLPFGAYMVVTDQSPAPLKVLVGY